MPDISVRLGNETTDLTGSVADHDELAVVITFFGLAMLPCAILPDDLQMSFARGVPGKAARLAHTCA